MLCYVKKKAMHVQITWHRISWRAHRNRNLPTCNSRRVQDSNGESCVGTTKPSASAIAFHRYIDCFVRVFIYKCPYHWISEHLKEWRQQMASWAFTAVDTFGLDRELVAVAFNMLDRYLSKEIKSVDCNDHFTREDFQLTSMTCLYLTVKILGPSKKLSVPALIDMSRGYYCAEDITETEMDILTVLDWRITPTTPLSFIQELASVIPTINKKDVMDSCSKLTEMAVMDEYFVGYKSSAVAAAVVLTASRQHSLDIDRSQDTHRSMDKG